MRTVVSEPDKGQAVYVALDLSRTKWVAVLRWNGCVRRRLSMPGSIAHLESLLSHYSEQSVRLVYEACGFGYEIAWWAKEHGITVIVVAPSTVERPRGAQVKTDRLDAATLCEKLEKGDLKSAYVPTRQEHELRQLSRTYDVARKECQRAQRRLRTLMQEQGRIGPAPASGWAMYQRWVRVQELPPAVAQCVRELLEMRDYAVAMAARLKTTLIEHAHSKTYAAVVEALRMQGGISELGAIRLVLEIGNVTRFTTADSFTNYLGLVPSEYSSGEIVHRGRIRKCGPSRVRTWLVESSWAAIHPRNRRMDAGLRAAYLRLRVRAGEKRAIIAVARRLALRVRARWLTALQITAAAA